MQSESIQLKVQQYLDQLVADGTELGAQVAAHLNGELIVHAWAGITNRRTAEAVSGDSLFPVFSTTKGMMATIIHRLAERGLLQYDTPIAEYWPKFAANGKEKVTLRHALTHTAGLPYIPLGLSMPELNDWDRVCAALALEPLVYEPGTRIQYHAITYGWLLGECASRVTGLTMPQLWEQEIRQPLGNDSLYCGLPAELNDNVAILEEAEPVVVEQPEEPVPESVPTSVRPLSGWMNIPAVRAACMPASNGIMTAKAVAKHYAALLPGGVEGIQLLPDSRVNEARVPIRNPEDPEAWGFALGYGPRGNGFGHGGYGGSLGHADPTLGLAYGFARNRFSESDTAGTVLTMIEEWVKNR